MSRCPAPRNRPPHHLHASARGQRTFACLFEGSTPYQSQLTWHLSFLRVARCLMKNQVRGLPLPRPLRAPPPPPPTQQQHPKPSDSSHPKYVGRRSVGRGQVVTMWLVEFQLVESLLQMGHSCEHHRVGEHDHAVAASADTHRVPAGSSGHQLLGQTKGAAASAIQRSLSRRLLLVSRERIQ